MNAAQIIEELESDARLFFAKKDVSALHQTILSAHAYPLEAGGKRVRPVALRYFAAALGGSVAFERARAAAFAIELIHTYSLVHDDLPCMDNDDLRRGKPTVHKVYGEDKALLVGDGLLTAAFEVIAKCDAARVPFLVSQLARAAGARGMVAGQWLDLSSEGKNVSWKELVEIHRLKTGQLLGACFSMGALLGLNDVAAGVSLEAECFALGEKVGLAFQIVDDVLDVTVDSKALGKTAGKDVEQDKATAVKLLGLEGAKRMAQELTDEVLSLLAQVFNQNALGKFRREQELFVNYVTDLISRKF